MQIELYATGSATVEDTWAVVGDPRRLPEWTDATEVERVAPEPVDVGTEVVVRAAGRQWTWRVVTAEPRLVEATTTTSSGTLGVGVRVVREGSGCRLILAGSLKTSGLLPRLRARTVEAAAWRRRFDRWSHAALDAAARA